VDYNRDWREQPGRPEIAALLQAIRRDHKRCPVSLVFDLHAPHHGDTACYLFGCAREDSPDLFVRQARLVRYLAEESPAGIGFRETDLRPGQCPEQSARHYLRTALTLELSYHLGQSGEYLTPRHYRTFGCAVLRAIDRWLQGPPHSP
jgi:predicted deacylase